LPSSAPGTSQLRAAEGMRPYRPVYLWCLGWEGTTLGNNSTNIPPLLLRRDLTA